MRWDEEVYSIIVSFLNNNYMIKKCKRVSVSFIPPASEC